MIIDPEFRALIPPPTADELAGLEAELRAHGIREPLVVWKDHGVLLDGHNRYEIAQRHGLAFSTVDYEFADRGAAADWIDRNQLGRRNLTPDQASYLRGRRYNRIKAPVGRPRSEEGNVAKVATFPSGSTRDALAREHGVSPKTIRNDGKFADAVEALKPVVPDIERQVISGTGPTRKAVRRAAAVAAQDPDAARALLVPPPRQTDRKRRPDGKSAIDRVVRAVDTITTIADELERTDPGDLSGDGAVPETLQRLKHALTKLGRFKRHLEELA